MDLLAVIVVPGASETLLAAEDTGGGGLSDQPVLDHRRGAHFALLLVALWVLAFKPVSKMLDERRSRIEQGLRDAEQARRDREAAEAERVAALQEARREAGEILARAQKVAQETRDADIAATREELERMRQRAAAEIQAEQQRAMADLRAEVANLALEAAAKVIGESMDDQRQRRLVEEFLREIRCPRVEGLMARRGAPRGDMPRQSSSLPSATMRSIAGATTWPPRWTSPMTRTSYAS